MEFGDGMDSMVWYRWYGIHYDPLKGERAEELRVRESEGDSVTCGVIGMSNKEINSTP